MADGRTPELRRMMVEYGEQFWKSGWAPLYGFLGGNPLAAMPSLHFATSVTAAHVLTDSRAAAAPLAWAYAGTLGLALVYLGRALRRGPGRRPRARRGRAPRLAGRRPARPGGEQRRPLPRAEGERVSETRRGRAHEGDQLLQDPELEALEIEAAEEGDEHGLEINRRYACSRSARSCCSRSPPCTSCCPSWPALQGTAAADRGRDVRRTPSAAAVRLLEAFSHRRDVPLHLPACGLELDRLARQLPDHDGGPGGLEDLRRAGCWRPRADGLGAAALGHAQAHRRGQDADVPDPHLHALYGRAHRLRPRVCGSGSSTGRRCSASPSCPRSSPRRP